MDKNYPKSICVCGHNGDGPNSAHMNEPVPGHGACVFPGCRCRKFTWKSWTPEVQAELDAAAVVDVGGDGLDRIAAVARRLYSEKRMTGDQMRNAAQMLHAILDNIGSDAIYQRHATYDSRLEEK